jgi:hypothetical protein
VQRVNEPTQMVLQYLEHCRENNDGVFSDPSSHPYFINRAVAKFMGRDTKTEECKESELRSLTQWAEMMVQSLVQTPAKEIVALGNHTLNGSDKEARKLSKTLLRSMTVVTAVFKSWVAAVDCEHVAAWVLRDGEKLQAAGKAPEISTAEVRGNLNEAVGGLVEQLKEFVAGLENAGEKAKKKEPAKSDNDDEAPKKAKKPNDDGPPVTPADVMKLLFDKIKNPSNN